MLLIIIAERLKRLFQAGLFQPRLSSGLTCCLLVALAFVSSACDKPKGIDGTKLSRELYLTGTGFYVISNQYRYLALEIKPGIYPHVFSKSYTSSDGITWASVDMDWIPLEGGTNVIIDGEQINISWERDNRTRATWDAWAKHTAVAVSNVKDVNMLDTKQLKFERPNPVALTNELKRILK